MLVDNKSVVDSTVQPPANIHKSYTALSFHRVRESVASNMVDFYHISGGDNPYDILSKHCIYINIWGLLQPLLFLIGDTMYFLDF